MKLNIKTICGQIARNCFYAFSYPIVQLFVKQDDNEVLFLSDSRKDFSGNFLYVKNEIEKLDKYNIKAILKEKLYIKRSFKEKLDLVKSVAKAKYVFLDDFYPIAYVLKLKKSKKLIQLWHAMGSYKTFGYARIGTTDGPKGYSLTHRNYTDTIVSSESIRKNYSDAFGISIDKVHALGIPRTDIFFDKEYEKNIKEKIYQKYPQLKNKKVILFAPTFRGKSQTVAYYDYNWIDFDRIKKEFNDEYICIIKMHPFIKNRPEYNFDGDDFYLDLTSEREINDLLFITDILITDYSSVIHEYAFFEKPLIFYIPDYNDYVDKRNFFYDFSKYNYGVSATNIDELIDALKNPSVNNEKRKQFIEDFCSSCDGHSSERVVQFFLGGKK